MTGVLARVCRVRARDFTRARTRHPAHARQNGKRLVRPATAALRADQIRKLHRSGLSKSAIASRLHIGRSSVRRILQSQRAES